MTGDIVDAETGLPRLLSDKCGTCIYRPGNLMHLEAGRRDEMAREALANGSWIPCHSTLPYHPNGSEQTAICRGFWDVHHRESWGCRLAIALGGPVEVPPPTETGDQDE